MKKWPDVITVNTVKVTIDFVESKNLPRSRNGEFSSVGGTPAIRVADYLEDEYRDYVVCHEIIHAWMGLNNLGEEIPDDVEERLVAALGHELARLLEQLS